MLRRLACLRSAALGLAALAFTPPALAACNGTNLIAALPPADRAALAAAANAVPFPQGNLWQATRGDQVVWLLGTMHLDDPRHDGVMEVATPLIDQATTVLVEAGPEEEAALQAAIGRDPGLMFITEGPTLPESLPPETWNRLAEALRARNMPPFLGAKMRPAYLSMILGIPPCAAEMLEGPANGLDQRVITRATEAGVPVRALEPYDTLFRIFDGLTEAEQIEMLDLALALDDRSGDVFATLADAYFTQDSRMMWEFSRWQTIDSGLMDPARVETDFAEMEEALMSARNRAWIPVIEAAADEGPVLAAFGALHLSGREGVLALMEREGFTLERLPF